MRKTTIRHIVHAILDLLPLFVIPIFAIYSRNENAQFGYEVTQEVNKVVDFNHISYNGYADSTDGWFATQGNLTLNGNALHLTCTSSNGGYFSTSIRKNNYWLDIKLNNKYYVSFYIYSNIAFRGGCYIPNLGGTNNYKNYNANELTKTEFTYNAISTASQTNVFFGFESAVNENDYLEISQFEVINLTQMYGEGNEPTISQFNEQFPNTYYPYTLSQEIVIENYETITYNDTDIGSQMIYTLYNTVDKYFNMNNVFNMNQVYQWFEINIFGGTAPLAIYIVWNIVLYEFVMDLLMLLYGLFMFFIDMCKKLMEKPLTSIK